MLRTLKQINILPFESISKMSLSSLISYKERNSHKNFDKKKKISHFFVMTWEVWFATQHWAAERRRCARRMSRTNFFISNRKKNRQTEKNDDIFFFRMERQADISYLKIGIKNIQKTSKRNLLRKTRFVKLRKT